MGMFRDFAKAFKEGMEEEPRQKAAETPGWAKKMTTKPPSNLPVFATWDGCVNLPCLVHECMTRDAVDLLASEHFEDVISKLPVLTRVVFKLRKMDEKTAPAGWGYGPDEVAVLTESGEFIGKLDKRRLERIGAKAGENRYGFVMPPSYDFREGFGITPTNRVFLFKDYTTIKNSMVGVIVF